MAKACALSCYLLIFLAGCAGAPKPAALSPEAVRCDGVSDSVSKYVSTDALPFAHLVGSPRILPAPAALQPGDSIAMELVVRPDGVADTSSVQIIGASDAQFLRGAMLFAKESRFTPAQISGCNVVSRYDIVVRGRPISR